MQTTTYNIYKTHISSFYSNKTVDNSYPYIININDRADRADTNVENS